MQHKQDMPIERENYNISKYYKFYKDEEYTLDE